MSRLRQSRVIVRLRRWECIYTWEGYVHKYGKPRENNQEPAGAWWGRWRK
jgi:hypothetical protein